MSRPAPSRLSTHSIMANFGFGGLTIHRKGVSIVIPREQMTREGNIKKAIAKRTDELTRENIEFLESRGVQVFTGGIGK